MERGTYLPHALRKNEAHGYTAVLEEPLPVGHCAEKLRDELLAVCVRGDLHNNMELVVHCSGIYA